MSRDLASAHLLTATETIAELGTSAQHGLTGDEARARLARLGPNEVASERGIPVWRRFLDQFRDILVVLLLVATAVSVVLWTYERDTALPYESMAIFAVVLLNAVMGFVQESRAAAALAALRAMSANDAEVIRDGERRSVPASELVPGDLVIIEQGNTVPADARVIESMSLQTAEAPLTGESLPVPKNSAPIIDEVSLGDRSNMVFSGTAAVSGRGIVVVTQTGMRTEIGRIARMLQETPAETTPLQRELDRIGKVLGIIVVVIALVMIATIIVVEDVHGFSAIVDILILGVALAVAAVPEGLPAVVTAVLSIGVQRMARRKAIVRHLAAVETLGSASIIASDKTGTLTRNEMTVRIVVTTSGNVSFQGSGYAPHGEVRREGGGMVDGPLRSEVERSLTAGHRANDASIREEGGRWMVQGDPTEAWFVRASDVTFAESGAPAATDLAPGLYRVAA